MRHSVPLAVLALVTIVVLVSVSALAVLPVRGEAPDAWDDAAALGASSVGQFANCRTGVGVAHNPITTYATDSLNLGWYVDWRARTPVPQNGFEYYFTVWTKQNTSDGVYLPTYRVSPPLSFATDGLGPVVQENPGSVWIVGNEPDIATQGGTEPEKYAEIYHEVYHFIKGIDPTAQLAIGGVVQPTPLRLQYLDRVLAAYRSRYGVKMPVDVWNTHLYIAREVRDDWGVNIPVGINDVDVGVIYSLADGANVEKFKELVLVLRTWMKARGYQDRPLIITEWGGLMPLWFLDDEGVTEQGFHAFLRDAIQFMSTAKDPNLGFAGDDYRLVQRQALWSLDADDVFPDGYPKFGPSLFRSTTPFAMTSTGQYYRDSIAATYPAVVDLSTYRAWAERSVVTLDAGETLSLTVKALVTNSGNSAFGQTSQVEFVNITGGAYEVLGRADLPPFTGCGTMREVSVLWPDVGPGLYRILVSIDPDNVAPNEASEGNNEMVISVLVGTHGVFLPLVQRNN